MRSLKLTCWILLILFFSIGIQSNAQNLEKWTIPAGGGFYLLNGGFFDVNTEINSLFELKTAPAAPSVIDVIK